MVDSNRFQGAIPATDFERLQFWKEEKLLTTIPVRLLLQTNWFAAEQDSIVVGTDDQKGEIHVGKLRDMLQDYSIIFKAPQDEFGKNRLEHVLLLLRTKQREVDKLDALVAARQHRKSREDGDGNTQRDVLYLQYLKERIQAPHPMIDSVINSFLDTMRFQVSEIGLAEMRHQQPMKRLRALSAVEDLDND